MQKTGSMETEVMLCGRLFQSRLPATRKARSPMVISHVNRPVSRADDDIGRENSCDPLSAAVWTYMAQEHGVRSWNALLTKLHTATVSIGMFESSF